MTKILFVWMALALSGYSQPEQDVRQAWERACKLADPRAELKTGFQEIKIGALKTNWLRGTCMLEAPEPPPEPEQKMDA